MLREPGAEELPALLRRCHGALMLLGDVEVFRYGVLADDLAAMLARARKGTSAR